MSLKLSHDKNFKSKDFWRLDNCKSRHYTLFYPINEGNTSNPSSNSTTQNYQTNHHTTIWQNEKTPERPQQTEAIVNTQLGTTNISTIIPAKKLSNGFTIIEINTLLDTN